jgi:hypothetical protein
MYDPRWDDVRERDDGRARVYDERDPADHDTRDGLMHDLDLPRGDARELVIDRDRVYEHIAWLYQYGYNRLSEANRVGGQFEARPRGVLAGRAPRGGPRT